MPTVSLDFDSTLVSCESLEEILRPRLAGRPDLVREIGRITELGMTGEIAFRDSLSRRLAIAQPTRADVERFAATAHRHLTPGIDRLVADLTGRGVTVEWVSGALREAMLPLARRLRIPSVRVHGVRAQWGRDGKFEGLRPDDPFAISKALGVKSMAAAWSRPRIGVGDGATDLALLHSGSIDRFVAFTLHVRRKAVLVPGVLEARDVAELRQLLEELL